MIDNEVIELELTRNEHEINISIDIEFCSYCIEKDNADPIKGCYCKVPTMKRLEVDSQNN